MRQKEARQRNAVMQVSRRGISPDRKSATALLARRKSVTALLARRKSVTAPLACRGGPVGRAARSPRGALAAFALLAPALLIGCGPSRAALAPVPRSFAKILMVRGYALRAILEQDEANARIFAGRTTYVVGPGRSWPGAGPITGTIEPTASYTSFAAFAADIASRRLPRGDHAVMYDIEKWAATPLVEQQHPLEYMTRFSKLARAHGLLPILAPGRDLVLAPGGSCVKRPGETLSRAYIRCGLAGADANAAVLVVQSQVDQSDVQIFHSFVGQAVKQARAANRRITVIAQLSTAPLGQVASLAQLVTAARSAAGLVQGFSLNVRMSDIPAAELLLRLLSQA